MAGKFSIYKYCKTGADWRYRKAAFYPNGDHGCADLDCTRACTNGGKQRERRTELAREVVNAKECAVSAQVFRGNSKVDRLKQGVGRRAYLRAGGLGPMPEREKADFF